MKIRITNTRRGLLAAAVGIAATALVLGSVSPADAAPASDLAAVDSGSFDHYAGSEIAKHEGHQGLADRTLIPMVTQTPGLDVSGYQGNVNWSSVRANGARFAYVKATEGTGYTNAYFAQQYNGSYNVGLIRGAYHFAHPNSSSGATQANYFVSHGGGWSRDGKTLPPMLDIEYNPSGSTCYGISQGAMRSWILDFSNTVHSRTGRYPTVYTSTNWWNQCVGNWTALGSTNPLFIARYSSSAGTLPAGWGFYTFWQFNDHGTFPGDQDVFNGAADRLVALANG
ncbi:hypothetical protein F0L68_20535 [Solihabitans fulvus]|uniref:Lysozyme n=1 Tax=Solihabitans fulvus TaxID=1892852 RepID=A0A5B2XA90_9PSEU|nr:lysozyme [Solihabitans fulvus]KAA2260116.1 hypothetical protein F0L68_20535 [Solihabitans fulvus]